jgi:four helix bundle suffix protein
MKPQSAGGSDRADGSGRFAQSSQLPEAGRSARKRLRPAGGYRSTASFQTATIIYDATYWFCEKFLDPRSRTVDQMVQAARSGRQNLAEGSRFAATSSQTELRLLNTARSSLEELLLDFEDYLRHRGLPQWAVDSPESKAVRAVAWNTDQRDRSELTELTDQQRWARYAPWLEHAAAAVRANAILCLIHQANYLLDRQITALEQAFIEEGGYSEQLAAARLSRRQARRDPSADADRSGQSDPAPRCPKCGRAMALRTARAGTTTGRQFWGCTGYPECRGTVEL